jgi:hypothetical protein
MIKCISRSSGKHRHEAYVYTRERALGILRLRHVVPLYYGYGNLIHNSVNVTDVMLTTVDRIGWNGCIHPNHGNFSLQRTAFAKERACVSLTDALEHMISCISVVLYSSTAIFVASLSIAT